MPRRLILLFLWLLPLACHAEQTAALEAQERPDRGWWWYETPPVADEEVVIVPAEPPPSDAAPEFVMPEDPCQSTDDWTVDCGFINPGKDFAFQAQQRDALLEHMVMNPEDTQAVEAFQYYSKWILDQSVSVANMWYYNRIQNPEIDPQASNPVSQFGIRLVRDLKTVKSKELFDLIGDSGGLLVYFTRTDCSFCHTMAGIIQKVARRTGLELWDASLDDQCLPGFERCMTQADTLKPAQLLQVTTVPTLFLYLEPSTWIRVSTGVTDMMTIESRLVNFFSAYRAALVKGLTPNENGRAPVDFSGASPYEGVGNGTGSQGRDPEAAPDSKPPMPDMGEIRRLMQP